MATLVAVKAEATLGGYPLILEGESVEWTLRPGVQPAIGSFLMAPADASALFAAKKPVTLVIKPVLGAPVTVQHLWVLNVEPGPHPWLSRVKVTDRRWFWPYKAVIRRYNMRRNVGTKRLLANPEALDIDFDRAFDIAYWDWSLTSHKTKWQPYTVLVDVMSDIAQVEKAYWGQTFDLVIDDRVGKKIGGLPIEELQLDDTGDAAVARAVSILPEAEVTVDYDGKVIVFSRAGGDEIKIVQALMPELFGQGHTDLVKNNVIRPSEIHVLFSREVELRFDFVENANAVGMTTTEEPLGNRRLMFNVLPVPDYQLTVNGRVFPQGSYVDFDDAFRSWPSIELRGAPARKLDHDLIQRAFIPEMDLWAALGLAGTVPDSQGTLSNWVGRIAACQTHYRQTFQLNPKWMDRILSFRAYRLSTINVQTGQRGPSMAYGDYCILPSQRGRLRNIAQGQPMYYAMNKTGYPGARDANGQLAVDAINPLDSTAIPGPGVVSILDHDQGVIRVDYVMDQVRSYEMVLPSQIQMDQMPTADIRQRQRPIAFNAVRGPVAPRLSPSFRMAIIVSAVPAAPNNSQQLHRIVVTPQDIKDFLPPAAQAGLSEANGPVMEIRIGAGTEVARIRWDDAKATVIEQIFGLTPVKSDAESQASFSKAVSELCLNEGSTGGAAGASLNSIAKARAASIYAQLVDRYEGSMTAHLNGNVHLAGWVTELTHEYTPKGETLTKVTFPTALPEMSLFSFLSTSERAVVLKLVQP